MADRRDHGHAQQRHRAAEGLVAEAQQVGERAAAARDDHDVDLAQRRQVAERAHDRRRRVSVLYGREAPHQAPRPATPGERREHVVARLAPLGRDHADRARHERAREQLLRLKQALAVELLAQPVDTRQQIALAGHAQVGDGEGEARRGGGAARVVVAAARDDDLHALARLAAGARHDRLPVGTPRGARQRPAGVAQLEVHAGARRP